MTSGGRHALDGGGPDEPSGGDELIDLLYGELSPDEERAVRARVAGDPALSAQLASFERVRELARAAAHEEPPPRISAQLLAEAAQAASRRRAAAPDAASSGWWARLRSWLQPVVAHPALTAATSVLVVAGVGTLLLLRGGDKLTSVRRELPEPSAATAPAPELGSADRSEPAAPAAEAPAPAGPAAGAAGGGGDLDRREADELAASGSGAAAGEGRTFAQKPRPKRARAPDAENADGTAEGDGRLAKNKTGERGALGLAEEKSPPVQNRLDDKKAEKAEPPAQAPKGQSSQADESGAEAGLPAASPPAAQPAPPPRTTETAKDADAAPTARDLHDRAVKAAASRRCLEVQQLDESIRKLDPAYHEKFVLRDKRLAVCLQAGKAAGKSRSK
ncbi:MAG TPA: hypothetical protein VKB80_21600 [Kofleriaceae bacterium]|nr:hypothetical protein [Kofleriaceae bacterium]